MNWFGGVLIIVLGLLWLADGTVGITPTGWAVIALAVAGLVAWRI